MSCTSSYSKRWLLFLGFTALPMMLFGAAEGLHAQIAPPPKLSRPLESLKGKSPTMPDLTGIVANESWVKATGKALFWDQQVGSDSTACASCHFHAGADSRINNQLNPGLKGGDTAFGTVQNKGKMGSGAAAGPNITLSGSDYPFHKLSDPTNRDSAVLYDTNDVTSSQGTFSGQFISKPEIPKQHVPEAVAKELAKLPRNAAVPKNLKKLMAQLLPGQATSESCDYAVDPIFHVKTGDMDKGVRKVEPRNTPTVINAIYNFRNFWDGRGNNLFNGVGVLGLRDVKNNPGARLAVSHGGQLRLEPLTLENASAASQANGPPLSDFEMSCAGKLFADLGRKMLPLAGLSQQRVDRDDSLFGKSGPLGDLVRPSGVGLRKTYEEMIRQGFDKKYWDNPGRYRIVTGADGKTASLIADPTGYTQMELNFPMFFGLAILVYESTLISDDSPFDRGELTSQQKLGRVIFEGNGKCIRCHDGALFSKAASYRGDEFQEPVLVERMVMADSSLYAYDGKVALYDNGFYNIGVRPTAEDLGVGDKDPYGTPFSFTRQWALGPKADVFDVDPCMFSVPFYGQQAVGCGPDNANHDKVPPKINLKTQMLAVDGAFKVPSLRNIGLTAPYFHNGGQATLEHVVAFYNRGGDFQNPEKDPDVEPLGLSPQEQAALIAFLKSFTDLRVSCSKAPFDHPELAIPDGQMPIDLNNDGRLTDRVKVLRATGAGGVPAAQCLVNSGALFDQARSFSYLPTR